MMRAWPVTITREGWLFVVILGVLFAAATIRDINLLMAFCAALTGLGLMNWRAATVSIRSVAAGRRLPRSVMAGEPFDVELRLSNAGRRGTGWLLEAVDRIESVEGPLCAADCRVAVGMLPGGAMKTVRYRGLLGRRGRYRFGPLVLRSSFPLGLIRCQRTLSAADTLTVVPRIGRLTPLWRRRHRDMQQESRQALARHGLPSGDFHSLRDFRPGDSRRWIHWRTTARQGVLMVRQFERHRNQDVIVVLDLWQPSRPGSDDWLRTERAVSFAATLAWDACQRGGGQFTLAIAGAKSSCERGPASSLLLADVLDSLAVAGPAVGAGESPAGAGSTPSLAREPSASGGKASRRDRSGPAATEPRGEAAAATSDPRLAVLLEQALARVSPDARLVVVSTRRLEIARLVRPGPLGSDPRQQAILSRALCVEVGSRAADEYFECDLG